MEQLRGGILKSNRIATNAITLKQNCLQKLNALIEGDLHEGNK